MSRSKWKGAFCKLNSLKFKVKKNLKIWSRSSSIPFFLLGKIVFVYNGKDFKKIFITREKIGYKFGEFSFTRKLGLRKKIKKSIK
jgi:small subunit ribosomal protein S19